MRHTFAVAEPDVSELMARLEALDEAQRMLWIGDGTMRAIKGPAALIRRGEIENERAKIRAELRASTSPETWSAARADLEKDLRKIGFVPRLFGFGLLLIMLLFALASVYNGAPPLLTTAFVVTPLVALACTFRVKARLSGDVLVVRSYLRTEEIALGDMSFSVAPYFGLWNFHNGAEGWLGGNIYVLVTWTADGISREVKATVCSRRTSERIARRLDDQAELLRDLAERPS